MENNRIGSNGRIVRLVFAAGGAVSSCAAADPNVIYAWGNVVGGSAGVATNWAPNGIPLAGDVLNFSLAATYPVSFPATVPSTLQWNFEHGHVTVSILSPHTASQQFTVGRLAASNNRVDLITGSLTTNIASMGSSGGTGELVVFGNATDALSTGVNGFRVGNGGHGRLTVLNGGSARATTGSITVGTTATSTGTITVADDMGGIAAELVTQHATAGDLVIGVNGTGDLFVIDGGIVSVSDDAFIGQNPGSNGEVNINSAAVLDSTMSVTGDLFIGANLAAASAGGVGAFRVHDGGVATVLGTTNVGDPDGGTGELELFSGSVMTTRSLTCVAPNGTLSLHGGRLDIVGGVLNAPGNVLAIDGASDPIIGVRGGSTGTLSAAFPARALTVATSQRGNLKVDTAANLTVSSGNSVIGDLLGSNGSIDVETTGVLSLPASSTFTVGNSGTGALRVNGLGIVNCGSLHIGALVGGIGHVTAANPSAVINANGAVRVGGSNSLAGGLGTLAIGLNTPNSGTLNITTGGGLSLLVFAPDGHMVVNAGGRVTMDGAAQMEGGFTLVDAVIDASTLRMMGAIDYQISGTVNGVFTVPTAGASVTLTENLVLGNSGSTGGGGIVNAGAIEVGTHTLTISGNVAGGNDLGTCHVSTSGRVVSAHALDVPVGTTLSGDGTIEAPINNLGTITPMGAPPGLRIANTLTGVGQGINGTSMRLASTGAFVGSGHIQASLDNLGSITATGPLTLGKADFASAYSGGGALNTSFHPVTIIDFNGCSVGQCTLGGGSVTLLGTSAGRNLNTGGGGHLRGFGTITAPFFNNVTGGQVSPGNPGSSGTGTIHVMANYDSVSNGPGSQLNIDIRDSESVDSLLIAARGFLGGTLNVSLLDGFVPDPGSRFTCIRAAVIIGTFDTHNLPLDAVVLYGGTEVEVYFPCPADFNVDGSVDFFDYDDFVACFEDPGCVLADFNEDGSIDFFDYDDFVLAFDAGC